MCGAHIGTNEIWRTIWLRWLKLGRGRSSGRHFGEVTARPAPQIEGVFDALRPSVRERWTWRKFKPTTQARDTDGMVWSNGCGVNAQPPTDARFWDVPSCVVMYPYPAKKISNLVSCPAALEATCGRRDNATTPGEQRADFDGATELAVRAFQKFHASVAAANGARLS